MHPEVRTADASMGPAGHRGRSGADASSRRASPGRCDPRHGRSARPGDAVLAGDHRTAHAPVAGGCLGGRCAQRSTVAGQEEELAERFKDVVRIADEDRRSARQLPSELADELKAAMSSTSKSIDELVTRISATSTSAGPLGLAHRCSNDVRCRGRADRSPDRGGGAVAAATNRQPAPPRPLRNRRRSAATRTVGRESGGSRLVRWESSWSGCIVPEVRPWSACWGPSASMQVARPISIRPPRTTRWDIASTSWVWQANETAFAALVRARDDPVGIDWDQLPVAAGGEVTATIDLASPNSTSTGRG